jgi:hypothetical protein
MNRQLDEFLTANGIESDEIAGAVYQSLLLVLFQRVCFVLSSQEELASFKRELRGTRSPDAKATAWNRFLAESTGAKLGDDERDRLKTLVSAFLEKGMQREGRSVLERHELLERSHYRCAFCGADLHNGQAHVDHIVPFKYVGDRLDGNLQVLCASCNETKSADLVYMMRALFQRIGYPVSQEGDEHAPVVSATRPNHEPRVKKPT